MAQEDVKLRCVIHEGSRDTLRELRAAYEDATEDVFGMRDSTLCASAALGNIAGAPEVGGATDLFTSHPLIVSLNNTVLGPCASQAPAPPVQQASGGSQDQS